MSEIDVGESTRRRMPRERFDALPQTHLALADAIAQGALLGSMLRHNGAAR